MDVFPIMNFLRHSAFAIQHYLVNRDEVMSTWAKYEKNQWLDKNIIYDSQMIKLQKLLLHSQQNVPHYRSIFNDIYGSPCHFVTFEEFQKIPLLDKETIRTNFKQFLATNISTNRMKKSSTSGSTGESLFFNLDLNAAASRMASTFRCYEWCGVSVFDRQAMLWGAPFDKPSMESIGDKLRAWVRPTLFLSTYELSEVNMAEYVARLNAFRPRILTSYPSPLEHFAKYCEQGKHTVPSLKAIICSGEQLAPHQRELFQRIFSVPIFNRYGNREFANIAHECDCHSGLHIDMERVLLEVVRADGSPCNPGEVGEIIITDLDNYAMPLIRYRTGDLGSLADRECFCKRGFPLLEKLEGRTFDLIYTPTGQTISGTFWTLMLRHVSEEILSFQVVQNSIGEITVLLQMADKPLNKEQLSELKNRIGSICPVIVVQVEYVKSISLTKSGKRRFVIGMGK